MKVPEQLRDAAKALLRNEFVINGGSIMRNTFKGRPRAVVDYLKRQRPLAWEGKPKMVEIKLED